MGRERVGEIRISRRTVQIGHEVYPLANISRVQSLRLVWGGRLATLYPLRQIAVTLLLAAVVVAAAELVPRLGLDATGVDVDDLARTVAAGAAVLAGVRIAYLLLVLLHRLLVRRSRYALMIETAGTQYAALSGTDRNEIHRIKGEIVRAIEDPPAHDRVVQVHGDLVIGEKVGRDKYQVGGAGNSMTVNK
ncbi:DUF6232 family protein [Microbispora sp. ATCC PTA-5024]|uniref:DUF6232 family protein n=1 Tax=Microbispora sp. ATCC PTA-5024 TaxID=316330 RepID=UPI0003DC7888|nr:DUF6232 family protein [Microbispora sp. ATCC PTA-5024]ETK33121.1 hypothetical protein MPTA5024_26335 [Microbispora sp. ATCC PTA-5024]